MRVAGILWESLVVGRVVASARSTDAGGRSLSPTRRHPTEACRQATPAWPRAPKPSGWDDQRPRRWSPRLGAAPNPRRARSRSAAERDHSEKINPATQPRRGRAPTPPAQASRTPQRTPPATARPGPAYRVFSNCGKKRKKKEKKKKIFLACLFAQIEGEWQGEWTWGGRHVCTVTRTGRTCAAAHRPSRGYRMLRAALPRLHANGVSGLTNRVRKGSKRVVPAWVLGLLARASPRAWPWIGAELVLTFGGCCWADAHCSLR
jgi:hypothetical protein